VPAVLAHSGGNLFSSVVLSAVFVGLAILIFFLLVAAILRHEDEDDEEWPSRRAERAHLHEREK
jgi:multisubunit Na+/H+ antiporter MnhC subunit